MIRLICSGIILHLTDFRRDHGKKYTMEEIMFMALSAIIANCTSWYEVAMFCREREAYFKSRLKGLMGIPSHDTFNRFFSLLDPDEFERAFRLSIAQVARRYKGVVAIDGKTIRSTANGSGGSMGKLHIVTAWAVENGISFGQVKVDDKTNEIPATQELISVLDLKGCTVTADALNCQRETVERIRERGGDYMLALKGNQRSLHEKVKKAWEGIDQKHVPPTRLSSFTTEDRGHGRREKRLFEMYSWGMRSMFPEWRDMRSIVRLTTTRTVVSTGKTQHTVSYYISSLPLDAARAGDIIRKHWQIENCLHWQLDVTFNEDATRKRRNAARNFSLLSKIALSALKANTAQGSLRWKRKKAALNTDFLDEILSYILDNQNI